MNLNWLQTIGALCGGALVALAVVVLLALKRRRMEARNERPPQRQKLVRPPGYSAMCRIDDLMEKLLFTLVQAVGTGVFFGVMTAACVPLLAGLALGRFTLAQVWSVPRSGMLAVGGVETLALLLWASWSVYRVSRILDETRNWRFGMRGEQAVAEQLANRELAAAGYVAFHDVPSDENWNIDHVGVRPGGLFVLETKARPRRKAIRQQEEQNVIFDGRVLQFPWCHDPDAVGQVEGNARWMRQFVAALGRRNWWCNQ